MTCRNDRRWIGMAECTVGIQSWTCVLRCWVFISLLLARVARRSSSMLAVCPCLEGQATVGNIDRVLQGVTNGRRMALPFFFEKSTVGNTASSMDPGDYSSYEYMPLHCIWSSLC